MRQQIRQNEEKASYTSKSELRENAKNNILYAVRWGYSGLTVIGRFSPEDRESLNEWYVTW